MHRRLILGLTTFFVLAAVLPAQDKTGDGWIELYENF